MEDTRVHKKNRNIKREMLDECWRVVGVQISNIIVQEQNREQHRKKHQKGLLRSKANTNYITGLWKLMHSVCGISSLAFSHLKGEDKSVLELRKGAKK